MIFDTHSHCYFEQLASREAEVVANMLQAGVTHSVQIGCDIPSSLSAINLARKYPNWYATVGYHPNDAQNPQLFNDRSREDGADELLASISESSDFRTGYEKWLRSLVEKNRDIVVWIGETGLDQHYLSDDPIERQRQMDEQYYWFERLSIMARDYELPLIIHSRDANRETLDSIKRFDIRYAVIHCFSEDLDFAEELMEFSDQIYFSFSGILTYRNSPEIQKTATQIPLNRILIETDAPFLSPQAVRGKTNEPAHTKYVLESLFSLRSEGLQTIEKQVFENSLRFYQIEN